MKRALLNSGEKILKNILDWLGISKDERIADDTVNIFTSGSLKDSNLQLGGIGAREFEIAAGTNDAPPAYRIKVKEGVAFDSNGERIVIPTVTVTYNATRPDTVTYNGLITIATPVSTGNDDVPVTVGYMNTVWVKYLETIDPNLYTIHKINKTKKFYKADDGYVLTTTTTVASPGTGYIRLADIDLSAITSPNPVTYSTVTSYANRSYAKVRENRVKIVTASSCVSINTSAYSDATEYFLDDHIKAVGTGPRNYKNPHGVSLSDTGSSEAIINSYHQRLFHDDGIIDDNFNALGYTYSGLVFKVANLSSSQYINIGDVGTATNVVVTTAIVNANVTPAQSYDTTAATATSANSENYSGLPNTTFIISVNYGTAQTYTFGAAFPDPATAAQVASVLILAGITVTASGGKVVVTSTSTVDSALLIGNGTSNSILGFTYNTLYEGNKTNIRLTLPDASTRYVYVSNAGLFGYGASVPAGQFPLYQVTTAGGNVSSVTDLRVFGTSKEIKTNETPFNFFRGSVTFSTITGAATTVTVVTFPRPFVNYSTAMFYFGCRGGALYNGSNFSAGTLSLTTGTTFSLYCTNNGTTDTNVKVDWIALGT